MRSQSCIYRMIFRDGHTYIGGTRNFSARKFAHLWKMRRGEAAYLLQVAYDAFGEPEWEILEECHPDNVSGREKALIALHQPTLNASPSQKEDKDPSLCLLQIQEAYELLKRCEPSAFAIAARQKLEELD